MIGVYDYTIIMTFLGLLSSVFGITRVIEGQYTMAIICLAISGLCDAFDGKIARTKKDRTDDEKMYGIQLDSLCDVICFGILPAILCYKLTEKNVISALVISYYCICSVTRLAFFNVIESNRQRVEGGCNKTYRGLPITSAAVLFPFIFIFKNIIQPDYFVVLLLVAMLVEGTLFILDFKVEKPSNKKLVLIISVTCCALLAVVLLRYRRIHRPNNVVKEPAFAPTIIMEEK